MTPAFRIVADDQDVTAVIADRLIALTVTDEDGRSADTLTLEIDDRDGAVEMPQTDMPLDLWLGYAGAALVPIGRFVVDRVRGHGMPQQLIVDATAANMTGPLRRPKTRGWTDKTLAEIVGTIAAEAGLEAVVSDALAQIRWPFVAQTAESDLHLLTRLARPLDATAKPTGGRLAVVARDTGRNVAGEALVPVAIDRSQMSGFAWHRGARAIYASVTAAWSDTDGGTAVTVTAGSGDPVRRLRHTYPTAAEAERACMAELAMAGRARLTLTADLFRFNGDLFAGGTLRTSGLRPEIDGDWLIRSVTHRLDKGLTTSFSAERALTATP